MTTAASNANSRLVDQIDAVLPSLRAGAGDDEFSSFDVLTYVRSQITPEGIAKRVERADPSVDENVAHLHQVAHEHLRRIGKGAAA